MELFKASRQWSTRPADERFFDLQEMLVAARVVKQQAVERPASVGDLRVEVRNEDLALVGKQGVPATVSHHAFGQLASRVGAPAGYLRELPATLAAQNLNYGLKALADAGSATDAKLLFNVNGNLVLRAATTTKYARAWDADIIERLVNELPATFKTPRAAPAGVPGERTRIATADDVMPGSRIKLGQTIAPAGAYLGDKNMFLFIIDTDHVIDDGTDSPLRRGFMLWNSEVADRKIGGQFFRFKDICQNHIVWGAKDVIEFEHRHVGRVNERVADSLNGFGLTLKQYANDSVSDEEAKISATRHMILGATKEDVVDAILGFAKVKKLDRITTKLVNASYDKAVEREAWYGNPHSLYSMVNGITEVAQTVTVHMDERHAIDTAAGRLLDMAF